MTFLFNAGQLKKVIHKYIRVLNSQNENFIFFIIFENIPMRWNETLTTHFCGGGPLELSGRASKKNFFCLRHPY